MTSHPPHIGRVTRCSTRGFVGAVRLPEPEIPIFGGLIKASAQQGQSMVIAAIYNIAIEDDEFSRQMAAVDNLPDPDLNDQFSRQVPVEYEAIALGYEVGEKYYYSLPPQPPLTLAKISPLSGEEIRRFTQQLDFIPLLLSQFGLPVDDLLAAILRMAAQARPEAERRRFLIEAGRRCARILSQDLIRLDNLLRSLMPATDTETAF
jgi:hypothetical protein